MTGRRSLQLLGSLALSLLFIAWALHGVELASVGRALREAHYALLAPAVLILVGIQGARIWRFRHLVAPLAEVPLAGLFRVGNIATMAVTLLPLRLGELVRPYLLKRDFGVPMSAGLGTAAAERVVDGLVVTLGFFAVTRLGVAVPLAMRRAGDVAIVVFVAAGVTLVGVLASHRRAADLVTRLMAPLSPRLAERLTGALQAFAQGLGGLSRGRAALRYLLWTCVLWGLSGLYYFVLFGAFGIAQPLSTAYVILGLTVIAVMVPAGPGFVGTFQFAVVEGLALLGVDRSAAFAYSICAHFILLAATVAFGLWSVLGAHQSLSTLVRASRESGE